VVSGSVGVVSGTVGGPPQPENRPIPINKINKIGNTSFSDLLCFKISQLLSLIFFNIIIKNFINNPIKELGNWQS
jgi:hypothetical protein